MNEEWPQIVATGGPGGIGAVEIAVTEPVEGTWWVVLTDQFDAEEVAVITLQAEKMHPRMREQLAESLAQAVAHYCHVTVMVARGVEKR